MPKLTDRFLTSLVLEDGRKDRLVFNSVTPGLGVRVTAKGTKQFLVQWTDPATKRKVRESLGQWGNLTIDQARDAAKVRLGAVAQGINPKAERQKLRAEAERQRAEAALTFDALISDWAALHLAVKRPRYAAEAERALRYAFADMMKRPAALITRADVVNKLDKKVKAGTVAMAGRTVAYGRAAFRWAQKRGKVAGNPFQDLPISAGATDRDRVLTDEELAEIWAAAENMAYPFGPCLRLAILTLQRREEVAGMRWSEISDDGSVWTIPGSRMKNGKPHDVHLSQPARGILAAINLVDGQDYIFSTTGKTPISGFSKAKMQLDAAIMAARTNTAATANKEALPLVPWRLHDFRRTGVSKLAALGVDSIVADKLLAHKPTKLRGVAAVYQRHDFKSERALALDTWAAQLTANHNASNVVKFGRVS